MTRYLTDGSFLYEIAAERTVQNFGLRRGVIRYIVLRDVSTEECSPTMNELDLLALRDVEP